MHINPNKRSDQRLYDVQKGETWSSYIKPVIFTLGKDILKLLAAGVLFLNCCEEPDDQGSLLQMKQGCSAIDS